ncbi:hypothetical protein PTKIN_Ptkin09bG0230400 [Pterospermum kingtungense]
MAGGRKKGGNKAKVKKLSIGDLVLAKVKGFPAWPAKISRPEDWEREIDPRKYFVQFFGTQEIAYVAPGDIQAFTSETKNKLSAKCQVVKTKYFVKAVKEISLAFDELHQEKSSGLRDETDKSTPDREASSLDGVEDDGAEAELKSGIGAVGAGGKTSREGKVDLASNVGSSRQVENNNEDVKPSISSHADDSTNLVMSFEGKHKISNGEQRRKEVLSPSSLDEPSHIKEEFSDDKASTFNCTKKTLKEDQTSKKMASGPKKRTEEEHKSATLFRDDKSGGCPDQPDSDEQLKDRVKGSVSDSV